MDKPKFKVGDQIQVRKACSGTITSKIYLLGLNEVGELCTNPNKDSLNGGRGCTCHSNWILEDPEWD